MKNHYAAKGLLIIAVFAAGVLTIPTINFAAKIYTAVERYAYLPGYVDLESKCVPIRANPEKYPYGPLGFRCDFKDLDGYIALHKELRKN